MRELKINHNYFENIDTEYKAYILGFIWADGSIGISKESLKNKKKEVYKIRERKRLTISIQEQDGYILKKLSEDLNVNLTRRNPPSTIKNNWMPQTRISLCSEQIVNDLIKCGCKINKSKVGMDYPNIDNLLIPHFIRGFFDGDGSLGIKTCKRKYARKTTHVLKNPGKAITYSLKLTFCSICKSFLEQIESFLVKNTDCSFSYEKQRNCYNMISYKTSSTLNIYDLLYNNANFFLTRKKEKINEFNMLIKSQVIDTSINGLETT